MTQRRVLALLLVLVAVLAAVAATMDAVRHRRFDAVATTMAVAAAIGAAWIFARAAS